MFGLLLLLHVLGAIVVFGPPIAFMFIAAESRRAPRHGHFAAVVSDAIERKLVLPGAVVQGVTGVALVVVGAYDLTHPASRWLVASLVLYAIAIVFAFAVQAPNSARMVELTRAAADAADPATANSPAPGSGGGPGDPRSEIPAVGRRLARGGMVLTVLMVVMVSLMVVKPGV